MGPPQRDGEEVKWRGDGDGGRGSGMILRFVVVATVDALFVDFRHFLLPHDHAFVIIIINQVMLFATKFVISALFLKGQ